LNSLGYVVLIAAICISTILVILRVYSRAGYHKKITIDDGMFRTNEEFRSICSQYQALAVAALVRFLSGIFAQAA
jgi:hypothetical protein